MIDVQQGSDHIFSLYPRELPTAASVTAYTSARSVLAGPTACTNTWAAKGVVSATSTAITIASAFTAGLLDEGDLVLVVRGDRSGLSCVARVDTITESGTVINVVDPLPFDLSSSDYVRVTRCTFTLDDAYTSTRQTGCYLEWSITYATGTTTSAVRKYETQFQVVRKPFETPATPSLVKKILSDAFPNDDRFGDTEIAAIADRATESIRAEVARGGRYIHLVSEPEHFDYAADLAIRLELAKRDLRPSGVDFMEWRKATLTDFREAVAMGIRQGRYDANDDGKEDVGELPGSRSIRIVC